MALFIIVCVILLIAWGADTINKKVFGVTSVQPGGQYLANVCRRCGSGNIAYENQYLGQKTRTTGEVRKKSKVVRNVNKGGRATANVMTLGMYGKFVPKKSEYKEITRGKSVAKNVTVGICQNCGNTWRA